MPVKAPKKPARPKKEKAVLSDQDLYDNPERRFEKYLGPPPILHGEDENKYKEIANAVRRHVTPTNVLEEVWARDYVDLLWEALRLRRFKAKLLYVTADDAAARVLQPFLREQFAEVRALAIGWATRSQKAVEEVDNLLKKAGLDREAIFAEILAEKLDVIERVDLMIFRAEQRRNAALHEIQRHRDNVENLRKLQAEFEEGMLRLPGGREVGPNRSR